MFDNQFAREMKLYNFNFNFNIS